MFNKIFAYIDIDGDLIDFDNDHDYMYLRYTGNGGKMMLFFVPESVGTIDPLINLDTLKRISSYYWTLA